MGYLFGGNTGETSESLAEARQRMALAMMQQGMDASPIRSPWQGAARLAEAVMGGLDLHQMQMQQNQANDELSAALSGQPYTPQPTPGLFSGLFGSGSPKVPASDAQGQIAASSPSPTTDASSPTPTGDSGGYRNAISGIESGGNYGAVGPTSPTMGRALGKYQVMEANIGPWSQEALGRTVTPDEFLKNPHIQDAIFDHKFGQYVQKYGPSGAAQAWFAGPGGVGKLDRKDVLGTTVAGYTNNFNKAMGQPTQVASLDPGAGIPAPAAAGEVGSTSPAPYRDPQVTTAYRQPQAPTPAAAAINQQAPQATGPGAIPPANANMAEDGSWTDANGVRRDVNGTAIDANGQLVNEPTAPQPDQTQTASILPNAAAAPPLAPPVNVGANPVPPQGPLPSPEAAQIPSPQPQGQQGDGATRLAQAVQNAPSGFQQQGNPLANPKAQALVHVMMNPYASSSAKSLAAGLLQQQMAPQIDYMTRPDGSVIGINKLTGESRVVTGPMKTDSIIEGPVDPQTGYATKLIWNPIDGVTGRIGLNGEKLPPGQFAGAGQQRQAAGGQGGQDQGAPTGPPPGVNAKTYFERRGNIAAENSMPTPKGELDFGNGVREQQSYKELSMALPTWNSFTQHITDNSPASDKAIVDDFAKILNPGRAVTTGAFQLNMDAQSVPANIQAQILKAFNGDGELGPDARAQMARVAEMKMQAYQQAWGVDSKQATDIATHYGYEPTRVVPQLEDMQPIDYSKINSVKTTAQGQGVAAPTAAADAPSGSPTATNANGDVIQWNGTAWVPVPRAGDPNSNMNRVPTGN